MPVALVSAKIDDDKRVRVLHVFLAPNQQEAEELQKKHGRGCLAYGPALEAEKTIDEIYDVDELPEADEESIAEFLASFGDEEEDEDDDGEEDEEEEEEESSDG